MIALVSVIFVVVFVVVVIITADDGGAVQNILRLKSERDRTRRLRSVRE